MARLGNILEPGEAVVRRYPPRLYGWILGAICVVGTGIVYFAGPPVPDGLGFIFLAIIAPVVAIFAIAGYLGVRWRALVTDRRIFVRQGMAGLGGIEQIQRAEIGEIHLGAAGVEIHAGGRWFRIRWAPGDRRRVMNTVDPFLAAAGRPAARLGSLMEPGEAVTARIRVPWSVWLEPEHPGLAFIVIGAVYLFSPLETRWPGLGFIALGLWPMAMSAQRIMRIGTWRVALTDRRLLWRFDHDPMRYDAMALRDIASCRYYRAGGKIVVAGAGRDLVIDCGEAQAARILKALGRDETAS